MAFPSGLVVRPFHPDDSAELTRLLHRSYADLGDRGLNFTAVDQTEETTLKRASRGQCWVVVDGPDLVATLTLSVPPGATLAALTPIAAQPGRAWLNQMAVNPHRQRTGLAGELWRHGRAWAHAQGVNSIGVDTAQPATHLAELYTRWGFTTADIIQWPGKTYRSTVMLLDLPSHDLDRAARPGVPS